MSDAVQRLINKYHNDPDAQAAAFAYNTLKDKLNSFRLRWEALCLFLKDVEGKQVADREDLNTPLKVTKTFLGEYCELLRDS